MEILSMSFLTLVVLAFALVLLVTGAFSAYFGSGKSRSAGIAMAVIGLVLGIVWVYLTADSGISPFTEVNTWDVIYNAIIDLIGVVIGALIAVAIFLVVVLKS
ncbi:hypothetical protein [Candidatus Methanoprimaticola sp. MG2]|uniref:hypothetical protein n=1 Tax=Candidatus Methanoprimaticola sp. MG2 TaxID=3228838 RepID=UPI0039C6D374